MTAGSLAFAVNSQGDQTTAKEGSQCSSSLAHREVVNGHSASGPAKPGPGCFSKHMCTHPDWSVMTQEYSTL